jgi:DNA-3-methyladenine glycosylase I
MEPKQVRCWSTRNLLYVKYHDEEWGTPTHDDRKLFEFLILEGFQAGLTWELILKRRTALREAFADFDPEKVAKYTTAQIQETLANPQVIRNKAKIHSTVNNAQKILEIQSEFGTFDKFIWQFVDGKPIDHKLKSMKEMPAQTEESSAMSKELKKRGFKFVGPIICYAFMQAVGMVNDHLTSCFRYRQIKRENTVLS